jgi:hypothetical protein
LNVVNRRVVVVLDLAQLEEAIYTTVRLSNLISHHKSTEEARLGQRMDSLLAALGRIVDEEIDGDVSYGSFQQDRHDVGRRGKGVRRGEYGGEDGVE